MSRKKRFVLIGVPFDNDLIARTTTCLMSSMNIFCKTENDDKVIIIIIIIMTLRE